MSYTLSIHGSCVSRDFAEFESWDVVHYQARSSMCTKASNPAIFSSKVLEKIQSNFQRRMVKWDLEIKKFNTNDSEILLIDLIDERFDIHRREGNLSTRSKAYFDSGVGDTIPGDLEKIIRGSDHHFSLFREGVKQFANWIDIPVILHDARWATKFRKDGEIFDMDNLKKCDFENKLLENLSEIILEEIDFSGVISCDEFCIADPNHKWGLAPFHYIPEYYTEIGHSIEKLFL